MNWTRLSRLQVEKEQEAEGVKEQLEREYSELFEEIGVLIPGAEVLFGFLLRAIRRANNAQS